jgi:hypothetical protein
MNSVCPSHPTSQKSILILSSYVGLDLQGGRFPSGFLIMINNETEIAAAAVAVVWWWW